MPAAPTETVLELKPQKRFELIDVSRESDEKLGDKIHNYAKAAYCSLHTTAGYLEQSLAARLLHSKDHVDPFIKVFRKLFPPNMNYRHDQLDLRTELSDEQKKDEPLNADSHLIFISSGLKNCVTYKNVPGQPVYFVELDGTNVNAPPRTRRTNLIYYNSEETVYNVRMPIPISQHPIDSVNLRDSKIGFMDELQHLLQKFEIEKGKIDISLCNDENSAGLTVNEYETLLMRHDLIDVLKNPFLYMAQKGKHMLENPRAIPGKTLNYAKYDLVHLFNEMMDAFRCSSSVVEKILAKFLQLPAERFLRMKRDITLLATNNGNESESRILQGTYQSPILVQWRSNDAGCRYVDVQLTRFK
ncbi:MAG: hypothetical protein DWQ05_15570 [Calditrichaeota bacterium]|nr:MAG: hypothetical protein DWQ05_15570 [Calditrichota bacterium]